MPIVFTWGGLTDLLAGFLQPASGVASDWSVGLYVNNFQPTLDTVLSDLVEAAFTGYSRRDLDEDEWNDPVQVSDRLESTYGTEPLKWVNTGTFVQNVYGYFVIDNTSGGLVLAELLPVPRTVDSTLDLELTLVVYSRNDQSPPTP